MDKKQKTFMKVTSIACLIESIILIFIALGMYYISKNVNDGAIVEILKDLKFVDVAGMYNLTDASGFSMTLSSQNISVIADSVRTLLFDNAITLMTIALINLFINIIVLIQANKGVYRKWSVIIGLIVCIFASNWLCFAFYIVVLCLGRSKRAEVLEKQAE